MAKRQTGKHTTPPTVREARRARREEQEQTWTAVPRVAPSSEKQAFLLVLSGPQLGEVFSLASERELVIGRREDAQVQIRDDGVSRRHAAIEVKGSGAVLRDLGSANGTWVDGRRTPEA